MCHQIFLCLLTILYLISLCNSFPHLAKRSDSNSTADSNSQCSNSFGRSPGVAFGVHIDWKAETPQVYSELFGRTPLIYGGFLRMGKGFDESGMQSHLNQLRQVSQNLNGTMQTPMYLLCVDPEDKLTGVSEGAMASVGRLCHEAQQHGIFVMVLFAHEFNGDWYSWAGDPANFIIVYRRFYTILKSLSPETPMIWSPNIYYSLNKNTTYADYYPGDEYVDWFGLSFYHFGVDWPPINGIAYPNKFFEGLTGRTIPGTANAYPSPDPAVDFYDTYVAAKNKPLMIAETGAPFYADTRTATANLTELDIKRSWWRQIYNGTILRQFPLIKAVMWFEYQKYEVFGSLGDHRAGAHPSSEIRDAFKSDLPSEMLFNDNRPCFTNVSDNAVPVWVWIVGAGGLVVALVFCCFFLTCCRRRRAAARNKGIDVFIRWCWGLFGRRNRKNEENTQMTSEEGQVKIEEDPLIKPEEEDKVKGENDNAMKIEENSSVKTLENSGVKVEEDSSVTTTEVKEKTEEDSVVMVSEDPL